MRKLELAVRDEIAYAVLCGPGEEELGRSVHRLLREPTALHDRPPRVGTHEAVPDLGELKALIARCDVLATTDAGPRHVAEALGVPTVVWMGPTDPRWSGCWPGVTKARPRRRSTWSTPNGCRRMVAAVWRVRRLQDRALSSRR